MKKNIFYAFLLLCLSTMFLLSPFSLHKNTKFASAENSFPSQSTSAALSIFIKKPIYTTYYDNKVYFIDKESSDTTLLKVYDSVYLTFENHYLDLSGYDSFLTVVSLNENLFAIATIEDKTILLKINLTTFDINELEIDLLTNDYNGIYVTTIEYEEKENYLISLTPSDTSNNSNPLIVMVSKDSFELISCSVLQFDSTEESKVSSIKQNLMKMFAFPAESINEVNIVFFFESNVSYTHILTNKLSQQVIEIKTATPFNVKLDNTNPEIYISNINIIDVNNLYHFLVTYYENEKTISISKLYHFNISDGADTEFVDKFYTDSTKNCNILTNLDYMIYPNGQSIIYKKINHDSSTKIYSTVKAEVSNPEVKVNYFSEDNFIYKQTLKETQLLSTPWSAEPVATIPANAQIIQIGSGLIQRARSAINDYTYCLYTVNNKNYTGFVTASSEYIDDCDYIDIKDYGYNQIITVADGTNLYSLPTVVVQETLITDTLSSKIIRKIEKETKLEIVDTICNYTANNCTLVKVKINDITGYINCSKIVEPNEFVDFIITNSAISKDGTKVFSSTSSDSQIKDVLDQNKMVRIDGARDTKTGFTHITYNDEYGNILSGYIVTDYVESDSWSTLQIIGCVLIAINIGLLILILYFKKEHIGKDGQKYVSSKKPNYKEH